MKNSSTPPVSQRRSFLTRLWIGLGLVALVEFLGGALFFLQSGKEQNKSDKTVSLIDAGAVQDFPPGSMTLIRQAHCYLSRLDDGGFLAISRKCTHLGCAVPWVAERNQFECPCHASVFDMTGNVIKAPAPRALELYPVTIERDMVRIDMGRPIRRSVFTPEQVVYPEARG